MNNISYITIQQYLAGKLDEKAMHELERQALDDPFLAEALEGFGQREFSSEKQLSLLQTQLQARIAQQVENKNLFYFSWQRLSIAAAAGLLFVTASILFWIKADKKEQQLASNPKQVEVNRSSEDSIISNPNLKEEKLIPEEEHKSTSEISSIKKATISEPLIAKNEETGNTSAQKAKVSETLIAKNEVRESMPENTGEVLISQTPLEKKARLASSFTVTARDMEEISASSISQARQSPKGEAANADQSYLKDTLGAAPVTGWIKYQEYLKTNIRQADNQAEGLVVLSFTIKKNGEIKNIKVEIGLNSAQNLEAIRLIKEGPLWKAGEAKAGRVTVEFKK
ncbi:MAG: hypothetical protein H7Y07_08650 [Pyrinomonadaceae bacterium]|nr:hypothetical protein [Sphingobacteriaceae bacterium]